MDEDAVNQTKRCSKCGTVKPISAFSKQSDVKNGRRSHCKDCEHAFYIARRHEKLEVQRAYYDAHKGARLAYARAYRIANAGEIREKQRLARLAHLDERHAYDRRRYKNNRDERIMQAHNRRVAGGQRLTTQIVRELKNEYGGICPYCGKSIAKGHIDHIVPVASDGTNDRSNLVYCCASCNHSKVDKSLLEFLMFRQQAGGVA